jgi:hypothetical protein
MLLILPVDQVDRLDHLADLIDSLSSRMDRPDRLAIRCLVGATTKTLRALARDSVDHENREIDGVVDVAYRLIETLGTAIDGQPSIEGTHAIQVGIIGSGKT